MVDTVHIFESCVGQLYFMVDLDDSYVEPCHLCGDTDDYLGEYESREEVREELLERGYSASAVEEFIDTLPEFEGEF